MVVFAFLLTVCPLYSGLHHMIPDHTVIKTVRKGFPSITYVKSVENPYVQYTIFILRCGSVTNQLICIVLLEQISC